MSWSNQGCPPGWPAASPWPAPPDYLLIKEPADVQPRSMVVCTPPTVPSTVTVAAAPSGAGELVLTSLTVARNVGTLTVSSGVPGRVYTLAVTTTGTDGTTTGLLYYQPVSDVLAVDPPPEPPSAGFSTAITWP